MTLKYTRFYDVGKGLIKDDRADSTARDLKVYQTDRRTDVRNFTCDRLQKLHILTRHTFEFNDLENRNVLKNAAYERLLPKVLYNQLRT
jgi:hypothetical protein